MFASANHARFTLTIDGDQNELKVLGFTGKEAISQPFRFDLELVSERPDIDLDGLLHRQAFLRFGSPNTGIHGQIYRAGQGDSGKRLTRYQVSLVPRLAYLDHRINQRIFQHKSVPTIIEHILKEHGIQRDAFDFQLGSQYAEREYCVQYAESDLTFIQRLCSELGIHYHFQHHPDGHLLVFGDDQMVFRQLPGSVPYLPDNGMVTEASAVKRFNVHLQTRTTAVSLQDYDFHKPGLQLQSSTANPKQPALEHYQFPGHFTRREHGAKLAVRTLQRHNADGCQAQGDSDQADLLSGHSLQLIDHPRAQWNAPWLITHLEHQGRQPQVLEEMMVSDGADAFQGYRNTFVATPSTVFFRPKLIEKPHVAGYQPAVVTGPTGSEIHCDKYGRVKVQLRWDRDGKSNEHSSCWLRVATGWAHDRYGSVMIPRVGMEVLVGFVNGDADKPLIVGCLPNAATPVPLDLPADKTRSIFRSQSSPGGGGYNELRIEDRKGAEEIYLRAERNWTQEVKHDSQLNVGSQHEVTIGSDDILCVTGDRRISVSNQMLTASGLYQVSASEHVVIDAGVTATIQAGGHWINIGPAGIFSSVPIQLGGAPMPAMGAPDMSGKLSALSAAQLLSFGKDAPFCEECERCKGGVCAA